MESSELPEPASHAGTGTDVLAPNQPPDRAADAPTPPFMGSLGIQTPPSPDAIDNARRGTWVMNDYLDGWMLMGANGRPVMRADGSKVAFWFRDIDRLAREWAPAEGSPSLATKRRAGLAALDSGFGSDWDPATGQAYRADVTKSARLLAYDFAQRTEPEEAVQRAIAMVLGDPVTVSEGNIDAFMPKRFNLAAAKTVANAMWTDLVGAESPSVESSELDAPFDNAPNDEGDARHDGPLGESSFDDVVDAWLEDTFPSVVSALNGENEEDIRVYLHEVAERLKPFTRAIVEQHTTIRSGKLEVDKLFGPIKALLDLVRDPDGAAFIVALATRYRSQLNRAVSAKERQDWWMEEARKNPKKYKKKDLDNMKNGRAEKDAKGKSMELHHVDGTHEGGLKKMRFYDHRGGPNYLKNHPWLGSKKDKNEKKK